VQRGRDSLAKEPLSSEVQDAAAASSVARPANAAIRFQLPHTLFRAEDIPETSFCPVFVNSCGSMPATPCLRNNREQEEKKQEEEKLRELEKKNSDKRATAAS
jgi:hypothetical protein